MIRKKMYKKIQSFKRQGYSRNEISAELGIDPKTTAYGKGKLKYIGKGKQKYIGNGKQKCIPEGKQKYTIES